jgi:IMP cyclohydrolase
LDLGLSAMFYEGYAYERLVTVDDDIYVGWVQNAEVKVHSVGFRSSEKYVLTVFQRYERTVYTREGEPHGSLCKGDVITIYVSEAV